MLVFLLDVKLQQVTVNLITSCPPEVRVVWAHTEDKGSTLLTAACERYFESILCCIYRFEHDIEFIRVSSLLPRRWSKSQCSRSKWASKLSLNFRRFRGKSTSFLFSCDLIIKSNRTSAFNIIFFFEWLRIYCSKFIWLCSVICLGH